MSNRRPRIAVVGAGVNGVASSLAILQAFPSVNLTVYSQYFSPDTTSDGAGGLWGPFISPGTSKDKILEWSKITWDLFDSWRKEKRKEILLIPVRTVSRETLDTPFWSMIPFNYRELSQPEIREIGPEYANGHTYSAYVAETGIFLPKLMKEVQLLGGRLERRYIRSFRDLKEEADIVINCSGLGALDLVPDSSVYPVRGQVIRVKCPQVNFAINDESEDTFSYVFPNYSSVVLGGTHQEDDWRTSIDEEDSKTIWKNCTKLIPEIKGCEVVKEWVGLRPARKNGIRLETEEFNFETKLLPVVHNYGHGGSGITTFWGCAMEVRENVRKLLQRNFGQYTSKL